MPSLQWCWAFDFFYLCSLAAHVMPMIVRPQFRMLCSSRDRVEPSGHRVLLRCSLPKVIASVWAIDLLFHRMGGSPSARTPFPCSHPDFVRPGPPRLLSGCDLILERQHDYGVFSFLTKSCHSGLRGPRPHALELWFLSLRGV